MKTKERIREDVRGYYAVRARGASSCCGESSNIGNGNYDLHMLDGMLDDVSTFSLGCGDPITLAGLNEGETVLDLGSGGGLDCFLAAKRVGRRGRVIGVDMTLEMLAKARAQAVRLGMNHVEFREGYLEDLPVVDQSVDVVISNCVINLSPDKPVVFKEILRVLKPGGRMAISDIVSKGEVSNELKQDGVAWASCASGALSVEEFQRSLQEVGFVNVQVILQDEISIPLPRIPEGTFFSARIIAQKPSN